MIDIPVDEYPEGTGYSCACEECNCLEETDYPDQPCRACFFGSHNTDAEG